MTYRPHRDNRFEYLWEVMSFIEENQCRTCVFSKLQDDHTEMTHAEEFPMCWEIEGEMVAEEPMECLDDHGDEGVRCNKYVEA